MKFNYYLFDLDNSLLYIPNPPEYFDKILEKTLKSFSINKIPEKIRRNKFWTSGDQYQTLLKEWGLFLEDYDRFWEHFDTIDFKIRKNFIKKGKIRLYSDVLYVLDKLLDADKKLAIVSNTARYIVDYVLEKFDIKHYFLEILGLGDENEQEIAKPSPDGINMILNKLNFNLNESTALMIGDSISDISAAKRANINACLLIRNFEKYPDGYSDWDYQPDFVIEDLNQLLILKPK